MQFSGQPSSSGHPEDGRLSAIHAREFIVQAEEGDTKTVTDTVLPMLEARLRSLTSMVNRLNAQNKTLKHSLMEQSRAVACLGQEKAELQEQLALFTVTNGAVIDGLSAILRRLPDDGAGGLGGGVA